MLICVNYDMDMIMCWNIKLDIEECKASARSFEKKLDMIFRGQHGGLLGDLARKVERKLIISNELNLYIDLYTNLIH